MGHVRVQLFSARRFATIDRIRASLNRGLATNERTSPRRCSLIPDQPLSVSFKVAAALTSVSRNTLRRYAKSGRLRTVRLGRRRVIPFDALKNLIQEGSGEGSAREVR